MSNPVTDLKRELLAAAERQHQPAPEPVKERRFRGSARVPRLLPIAAAVAVAAAAVLFFTAPWSSSPKNHPRVAPPQLVSFLVKTEAALTPPKDKILHAELESTGCSGKVRWTAQFWSDEHTGAYRGLFHDPVLPYPFRYFSLWELQHLACMRPHTYEAGAVPGPRNLLVWSDQQKKFIRTTRLLRFVPPNTLYRYPFDVGLDTFGRIPALDPVKAVRDAIRAGRAHDQGRTTLHGRTVERIRVNPCPPNKPSLCTGGLIADGGYAYVDPKTHYPVEIRAGGGTTRFATYEYLPRTAPNLALTNIRAQHPHARVTPRG
jgi:hypothetical protein